MERYDLAREQALRMPVFSFRQGRAVKAERSATVDLGSWTSLGPGNTGGRTRVLLIHPSNPEIMYAGAVTGSIWKTTDGGENWKPIADLLPSLGIGAMTFHPNDPETIFAGTGFWFNTLSSSNTFGSAPRGAGIYKSTDGGATWQKHGNPDPVSFRFINRIHISRHDPNRMYAATYTGVWRSFDGGETWTSSLRPANSTSGCQSLVMRTDVDTDYLFAACGANVAEQPAIYRNSNAGANGTWERVLQPTGMGNTTLALAPSNQSIIYSLSASVETNKPEFRNGLLAVYRSTANGDPESWEARVTNEDPEAMNRALLSSNSSAFSNICGNGQPDFASQGWIHNAIAVDPRDPDRVFVGGIDIYRSDDGGKNWGIASFWQADGTPRGAHADTLNFAFHPAFDGESNQVMFVVGDGGIYRTRNSRAATARGPRGGCTPYTNAISWEPLHTGYSTLQFYTGAVYPGGAAYFGGAQDNGTRRGTEGGQANWNSLRGGDGAAVLVNPENPNIIYVSTQNFGFTRSINGGQTFSGATRGVDDPAPAFITPVAMDPSDPQRLWTGGRRFWTTADGGTQWTAASVVGEAVNGSVSAIAISRTEPDRVWMATSTGFIYRSRQARSATPETVWESVRPRTGFVSSLAVDPQNAEIVYATYSQFNTAAAAGHIYRSTDGGANWQRFEGTGDDAIPDIPVLQLLVDPDNGQRLFLATDIGVFISTDGGLNWARDAGPFANVVTETLVLSRDTGVTRLYAFTFGRGAWRTELPDSGTPCTYEIPALPAASAFGGELSLPVETGENCRWSAVPFGTLITLSNPPTGKGRGSVRYSLPLNTSQQARQIGLDVQHRSLRSTQAGAVSAGRNDELTTAPNVTTLPYVGVSDTRQFTVNNSDPKASCLAAAGQKTAWWTVTASATGEMEIAVQGQRYDAAGNSGFVAAVYPMTGTTLDAELACTTVARNTGAWVFGRVTIPVTAGRRYAIVVGATGTSAVDGGYTVVGAALK